MNCLHVEGKTLHCNITTSISIRNALPYVSVLLFYFTFYLIFCKTLPSVANVFALCECSIITWMRSLARCASANRIPPCRQFREAFQTGWRLHQPERRLKIVYQELSENWTGTRIEYVIEIFLKWEHLVAVGLFSEEVSPPSSGLSANSAASSFPLRCAWTGMHRR